MIRFSTLDRAQSIVGDADSQAVARTLEHARYVERLGFERFMVAEHHGVPGIPGSQPAMLAAAIGQVTESIRVGTAGIQLPNYNPFIAAEQVGVLSALVPGRVDIGIGNSVGFTEPVRQALRQGSPEEMKAAYDGEVDEFLSYLSRSAAVTMRPGVDKQDGFHVWMLAGFRSIARAAEKGLGVIIGGPQLLEDSAGDGVNRYLREFNRDGFEEKPRVIISLDIAVADTEEDARNLLLPQVVASVLSRRTGEFGALPRIEDIDQAVFSAKERARITDSLATTITGTPQQVKRRVQSIVSRTGVDEILITGGMSDLEGRAKSEEILAELATEITT